MAKAKGYKTPTRTSKLRVELEHAINEAKTYSDMNNRELCLSLGISEATLGRRLRAPDQFTLGELRVLAMLGGRDYSAFLAEIVK